MKKRFLNLLLALALVVCVLPMAADAATGCVHNKTDKSTVKLVSATVTCEEDGYAAYYACTVCNKVYAPTTSGWTKAEKVFVSATGHTEEEIPAVAPTCTEAGLTAGVKCSTCSKVLEAQEPIAAAHDYEITITKEATCTEEGVKKFDCKNCDAWFNWPISKVAHTPKVNPAEAPTCTTKGWTEGSVCAVCNTPLVYRQEIAALNHNYTEDLGYREGDEPTCTEAGYRVLGCSRCDATTAQDASAIGHEFEMTVTDPTCTEAGRKKYTCTRVGCDAWYAEQIDALNHDYTEDLGYREGDEPTCVEDGIRVIACSRCDATTAQTAYALGHDWDITVLKEASCNIKGMEFHQCKREGCAVWKYVEIDALEHNKVVVDAVAPTCTATGLTAGEKCSVCGEVFTAQTVVEKLPHAWEDVEAQDPTCKADGYNAHKACTECGETDGKTVIPASAAYHEYENFKCKHCGAYDPSHQHQGTGVVTTESTCTAEGVKSFECTGCGHTWTESVAKKPHTYNAKARCTDCGELDPAHQHTYVQTDYRAPTCTVEGKVTKKCSVCDDLTETLIDANGHSYENGKCVGCGIAAACAHDHTTTTVESNPTCKRAGKKVTTCDSCGKTVGTETIPATGKHNYVNNRCTGCGQNDPSRITNDFQDVFIVG